MRRCIFAVVLVVAVSLGPGAPSDAKLTIGGGAASDGRSGNINAQQSTSVAGASPAVAGTGGPAKRVCVVEMRSSAGPSTGVKSIIPCDAFDAGSATVGIPIEEAPPEDPVVSAATIAQQHLENLPMPVPQPTMSAPQGITGAEHSVDLRVPDVHGYSTDTPEFGPLRATARGVFTIDWGDGTVETFTSSGAPWPHSELRHSWPTAGAYDVTVTAGWNLSWRLGGFSGVIGGLSTSGVVEDWPVIEAQATLTR